MPFFKCLSFTTKQTGFVRYILCPGLKLWSYLQTLAALTTSNFLNLFTDTVTANNEGWLAALKNNSHEDTL